MEKNTELENMNLEETAERSELSGGLEHHLHKPKHL